MERESIHTMKQQRAAQRCLTGFQMVAVCETIHFVKLKFAGFFPSCQVGPFSPS